jgi:hypothetical protein
MPRHPWPQHQHHPRAQEAGFLGTSDVAEAGNLAPLRHVPPPETQLKRLANLTAAFVLLDRCHRHKAIVTA